MNYKKTIRLFEPFGGWGSHASFYNPELSEFEETSFDTGLCNRLLNWESIYYILEQIKDDDLHIAVQKHMWPELPLLDLPDTIGVGYNIWKNDWYGKHEHGDLFFKAILDDENDKITLSKKLSKESVLDLYKNKNFKNILKEPHWYTDTGFITLKSILEEINNIDIKSKNDKLFPNKRPLGKINLRDRKIHDKIEIKYSSYIGIHIRRGNGVHLPDIVLNSLHSDIKDRYLQYKKDYIKNDNPHYRFAFDNEYFKIIDKILEINPKQQFYISHDLPDEFLDSYYKKYPKNITTKKDIRKQYYTHYKKSIPNLDQLIKYANILDNTLDLIILATCGFKILSKSSTWSNFADYYQRDFSPPTAKENYLIDDIDELVENTDKLKDILSNLPEPQKMM